MTQDEFCKVVGLGSSTWWQVLHGRRNLGWRNAKKVAKEIGGDPNLWREGGETEQRQKAWEKYQEKSK